jgi:hypothetical protein
MRASSASHGFRWAETNVEPISSSRYAPATTGGEIRRSGRDPSPAQSSIDRTTQRAVRGPARSNVFARIEASRTCFPQVNTEKI